MVARQVVFHTTRVSLKMSMSRGSTVKQQGQTLHRNYVSNSLLWYIVIYHCCHFIRMFYPHECNRNTAQELAANEMLIPWIIVPAHLTLTLFPFFFFHPLSWILLLLLHLIPAPFSYLPICMEHVAMESVRRLRCPCCHIFFKDNLSSPTPLHFCLSLLFSIISIMSLSHSVSHLLWDWDHVPLQGSSPLPPEIFRKRKITSSLQKTKWKKWKKLQCCAGVKIIFNLLTASVFSHSSISLILDCYVITFTTVAVAWLQ